MGIEDRKKQLRAIGRKPAHPELVAAALEQDKEDGGF
jgi:hypothetical protein